MSTLVVRMLQKYWRLTRGLTLVAEACVIDAEGRILLIPAGGNPNTPANTPTTSSVLPHASVRRGESLADAIRRGLHDDLALEPASEPELLAIRPWASPDGPGQIATFLIRRWTRGPSMKPSAPAVEFAAADALPAALDGETKLRILAALDRRPPGEM